MFFMIEVVFENFIRVPKQPQSSDRLKTIDADIRNVKKIKTPEDTHNVVFAY